MCSCTLLSEQLLLGGPRRPAPPPCRPPRSPWRGSRHPGREGHFVYVYIYIYIYIERERDFAVFVLYSIADCMVLLFNSEESSWSGWNYPAWCLGGRMPLIAGRLSLQGLGMDLPITRPVWDSNPRPPASETRS